MAMLGEWGWDNDGHRKLNWVKERGEGVECRLQATNKCVVEGDVEGGESWRNSQARDGSSLVSLLLRSGPAACWTARYCYGAAAWATVSASASAQGCQGARVPGWHPVTQWHQDANSLASQLAGLVQASSNRRWKIGRFRPACESPAT